MIRPTKLLEINVPSEGDGVFSPCGFFPVPPGGELYPYQWNVTFSVTPQVHSSLETPSWYTYDGNDVNVGDCIFTTSQGRILTIVAISDKNPGSVTCTVEDVDAENLANDPTMMFDGSIQPGIGYLFEVRYGFPVLYPMPDVIMANVPAHFATSIFGRFFGSKLYYEIEVAQVAHGLLVNDTIYLDATGYHVAIANSFSTSQVLGTVTNVDIGPDKFRYRPIGPITATPMPSCDNGSVIYLSPSGGLTNIKPTAPNIVVPVFVKIDDDHGMLLSLGPEGAPIQHAAQHTDGTDQIANFIGDGAQGGPQAGFVPAPLPGYGAQGRVLCADGTWVLQTGGSQGGNQGPQGFQGEGVQGIQGVQGEGVQGSQGEGVQGAQGEGVQGIQGVQGEGVQGVQGADGSGGGAIPGAKYWFDNGGSDLATPISTGTDIAFVNSNPDTITRVSGDFVADGWKVGQRVTVSGAAQSGNNGIFAIAGVATNTLTLNDAASLTAESTGASVTLKIYDDRFIRTPSTGVEQDKSVNVTSADTNGVPINNFITITGIPGELAIPSGTWTFTGWFWTSSGSPTIKYEVCKRGSDGSTTVLFTTNATSAITATSNVTAQEIQVSYAISSPITLLEDDRIIVRVLAFSATNCTVHFVYEGLTRASYVSTTFNSITYSNDLPVPIAVGGIKAGDTFLDVPLVGMWDTLLYPELFPTLVNPSNAFALPQSGLHEIGEIIASLNFTATFSRGSITPNYSTSGFRSGLPNTYKYTGSTLPATVGSTSLTDLQTISSYTVLSGVQSWTSVVSYDVGEQPKSNKGNDYSTPLPAGDTGAATVSIIGVYPYFATTVSIAVLTKQALAVLSPYLQVTMVAEDDTDKQKAEFPAVTPITGVQFFNTVSSTWEWINGSKANSLMTWTTSSVSNTVQGNVVAYTRYTNNSSKIGSRQLRWYTT